MPRISHRSSKLAPKPWTRLFLHPIFAAVLATSGTNSGLTRDREKLKQAIMGLRVNLLYRDSGHDCPNMSYYQGGLIVNNNDSMALQAATQETMTCAQIAVPEFAAGIAEQEPAVP